MQQTKTDTVTKTICNGNEQREGADHLSPKQFKEELGTPDRVSKYLHCTQLQSKNCSNYLIYHNAHLDTLVQFQPCNATNKN